MFDVFVVTAVGLETIVQRECADLGLSGRAVAGGVELRASLADVQRLNLRLRGATRVVVRLGTFKATAFAELVRKASDLPWERFVPAGAGVVVRATCKKSRLYHSAAVAERVYLALQSRVRGVNLAGSAGDEAEGPGQLPAQLLLARLDHDACTISVDSSGELLHRRGWRGPSAKAPLRETLAAALLLAAGYAGDRPLCDPLCGSGTLAIEGASIAMRRAPGLLRRFAFEAWPSFAPSQWEELRGRARAEERSPPAAIEASDQDGGAIAAARRNAQAAGVELILLQRRLADLPAEAGAGLVACNPPYGVRIAAGNVWRELGDALRRRPGWRTAAVIADARASREARLPWKVCARTENGGLPVELSVASVQTPT